MADLTSTFLIQGVDNLSGPAGSAEAALGRLEGRAGPVGAAFGAMAAVAAVAGVALGAGLGIAIKTAADFEKQLSAISAVSSKAELDAAGGMKALSDAALQLGKDTSFSASQAAAGMEEMVKAGISITDVLGGGARAALDLAAAGALDVAEAATVASSAMNAFGLAGKDLTHIADELAGASVASATDVHQLGFALASVGAVAHTVGIGFDDTVTAIAAMAQAGLKGSDAGTSLKTMLLNLTPTTKAQIAVAKELGIVTADGSNQFFDAAGNAKSMAEIAGVLQTATANLTKEQKIEALQTLFGTDAIRAAAIMASLGADGMRKMAKDTAAAGSAQAIANERLNNFTGSMEKFRGSLETATIIVGRAFLPALKRLTDWATDALNDFIPVVEMWADTLPAAIDYGAQTIEDAWRTIGQVLAGDWEPSEVIDPITEAIGEATVAFRDEFLPTIQATWGWIQDNADSIKAAFAGAAGGILAFTATSIGIDILTVALAAILSPIGLVAAAGAALGVAWVNNWGDIQGKTQIVIDWMTTTAVPTLITTWTTFSAWFTTTAMPAIVTAGSAAWNWITGTAIPALTELGTWLGPKIQQAFTWFTGTALPAIQAAGAAAWQWVTGTAIPALTEWAGWLQPKIQAAWEWLTATALPAIQAAGATAWAWVTDTAVPALQEFAAWMQPRLEAAWSWLTSTALPAIGTAAADVATQIQNLTTWFGNVVQAISSNQQIWTDLQGAWTAIKDIGAELVRDVLGPLGQGLQTDATSAQGLAAGIGDITSKIEPFIRGAQQVAEALNAAERAATNAGLALRWYLQMLGIPVPDNPIPNIVPSAPGSQSTGPLPSQPPTSGFPQPPSIITPQEPIQGPPIPSGFDPNAPSPAQSAAPPAGPQATGPIPNYPAPSAKAAPTAEPTPTSATGPYSATSWEGRAYAAAVAAGHPNPLVFVEQIRQESQFDPNARSPKGAIGIAQIMPGTAKAWGVDPTDPHASLITAAQHSSAYVNQYGLAAGLAAYNAGEGAVGQYGGVPPFKETQEYIRNITNRSLARAPGPYQIIPPEHEVPAEFTGGNPISALPAPKAPGGGLIPRGVAGFEQNQQDWDSQMADANAICGPHLATLFASAVGRPPTRDEAVAVAEKMGIYSSAGRGSGILNASQFDEYATALIQQMDPGSPYSVAQTPASGAQAGQLGQESLAGGAPIVGFNTPLHYFGATGYDPATGKFHVGGTGTSISAASGGKPDMTIAEMEAYGGRITNVITLLGDFQTANAAATESVSTMGASVDTSTTSLSAIGAAIDPVVASMDTGTTSVTAMTDAIIASAAGQGIATETATAYSMGLTDQTTALEGVLAGFAATTPAAAELLTQLQAGTITTDEAAVAFAGLATTTATATGEIGASSDVMSQKVITDFGTMQTGATAATGQMSAETITAASLMQAGVITAAELMQADTQGVVTLLQTGVITAADLMRDGTVNAADLMNLGVTTAAQTMQADATLAAQDLQADGTLALQELQTDGTIAAQGLQTDATTAFETMQSDASAALGILADDATTAFGDAGSAASDVVDPLGEAADAFGEAGDAAKDAAGPVKQFASAAASVKPINMGDTVKNLQAVEKQAKSAAKALTELGEAGKHVSGSGGSGGGGGTGGGRKGGGDDSVDATGTAVSAAIDMTSLAGIMHGQEPYPQEPGFVTIIWGAELTALAAQQAKELNAFMTTNTFTERTLNEFLSAQGVIWQEAQQRQSTLPPDAGRYPMPEPVRESSSGPAIDYDKLAAAIVSASKNISDRNFNLTVNTSALHEPIMQDFAILEAMSRRES